MKHVLALVGLVLLVAAGLALVHVVAVPVLAHFCWTGVFGSWTAFGKVVADVVVGSAGVALVRASR